MGEIDTVNKDVCKVIHKQVDEKFTAIDVYIQQNSSAVQKLQEVAASNNEILKILMEERAQRLDFAQNKKEEKLEVKPDTAPKMWQAPWFKYVVVTACIVAIVVIGAAIGNNLLDKYIQAMAILKGG